MHGVPVFSVFPLYKYTLYIIIFFKKNIYYSVNYYKNALLLACL